MEGIFDGRAVDGCFYCELLYPEACTDECPRCGRRMSYQPAIMMSDVELGALIRDRVRAFAGADAAARPDRLIELCEALHRFAPTSLAILEQLAPSGGPTLDDLRAEPGIRRHTTR